MQLITTAVFAVGKILPDNGEIGIPDARTAGVRARFGNREFARRKFLQVDDNRLDIIATFRTI